MGIITHVYYQQGTLADADAKTFKSAGGEFAKDTTRESLLVSTEAILARAPEVILALHYTDAPSRAFVDQAREAWSILSAVPAVKLGRVELLFGEELVLPGPRVVLTATAFARALHPALMAR